MGERKGQNKYYPPDFDPKKHGNLNNYHGTHALRERAKKIKQGIIIIRFELPFNIWCNGCENSVATGVRYNAEKTRIGNYYSTPIYEFKMRCHLCPNYISIKTDPQKQDYIVTDGARRKELRWDPHENEQIVPTPGLVKQKLNSDPMFKLDHEKDEQEVDMTRGNALSLKKLVSVRNEWEDDYSINIRLRNESRSQKNIEKFQHKIDKEMSLRLNLSIPLVKEKACDVKLAKSLFKNNVTKDKTPMKQLKQNLARNLRLKKRNLLQRTASESKNVINRKNEPLIDYPSSDD